MRTYIVSITYRSTVEVPEETSMAEVKDIVIDRFAEHIEDGGDCNDIEAFIQETTSSALKEGV